MLAKINILHGTNGCRARRSTLTSKRELVEIGNFILGLKLPLKVPKSGSVAANYESRDIRANFSIECDDVLIHLREGLIGEGRYPRQEARVPEVYGPGCCGADTSRRPRRYVARS